MTILNKVFRLDSQFTKELPSADEKIDNILISGYASSTNVDRVGDIIPSSVWEKGISNYLKNPVILAHHNHDDPVGRMIEHKVDAGGLWIKARISAAAEVFNLIKDGVLTAFSVGFRVLDATYDAATELFVIKELELIEISVVSVPCNQDTLFSLSKSFDTENEYKSFKLQFAPESESAKGLESSTEASSTTLKEIGMDPKELEQMLAKAAETAANNATKAILAAQEKAAADLAAKNAEEAAMQERINKAVAAVTPSTTGAEKLLADIEKRFAEQSATQKSMLEGLEATLKEKAAELEALQKSKMTFTDNKKEEYSYEDKEKAVLLSKITGKSIENTKFGKIVLAKALGAGAATGAHLPSQTWEHEVALTMHDEIRRRLVAAGLMRTVQMQTNVMSFPVNPEAGYGTWITNAQFGTSASSGAAQTHALKEITLSSYKLATKEYLAYEEEEDSLIAMLPIIRDAMVRRTAKSVDKAILIGAGDSAGPITGLAKYDTVSAVTAQVADKMTVAILGLLRKDLGVWGLEPSEVVFVVNTEGYYDLLEDTTFQTMDKVGDRATLLTGQIGSVGNSPVIVSGELPAKASGGNSGGVLTNVGAIAVNARNFVVGNQRGLRMDTDSDIENQRKILVASLRMGMTQLSTVDGLGVSAFRWLV